jgi:hypothetical protein
MAKQYCVILMENEQNCTVKRVSKNTYSQIRNMMDRGENNATILKSMVELNTREENIVINGVTQEEAVKYALEAGEDYVFIQAFHAFTD